jgi:hypothetical protein
MSTSWKTLTRALAAALLTTGCGLDASHLPEGVYTLRVDKTQDTCTPARPEGDFGTVRVEQSGHSTFAEHPSLLTSDPVRKGLVSASGLMGAEGAAEREFEAAVVIQEMTNLDRIDEKSFELDYRHSFKRQTDQTHWEGFPEANCEVRGRLVYTLQEACPAHCALVRDSETLPLQTRCACP